MSGLVLCANGSLTHFSQWCWHPINWPFCQLPSRNSIKQSSLTLYLSYINETSLTLSNQQIFYMEKNAIQQVNLFYLHIWLFLPFFFLYYTDCMKSTSIPRANKNATMFSWLSIIVTLKIVFIKISTHVSQVLVSIR